jgi:single-stranded DNA-binding protein
MVQLIGATGNAPEMTQLSDGTYRTKSRLYQGLPGGGRQVFHLVLWQGIAQSFHRQIGKGDQVLIQGVLRNRPIPVGEKIAVRTEVHVTQFLRLRRGVGKESVVQAKDRTV